MTERNSSSFEEDPDDDDDDDDTDHTRYYTMLRLEPTCSLEEIQRAYKQLSRVFHPDKGVGDVADDETFIALQHCVEVLTDRVLRLAYDTGGVTAVRLVQRSMQQQPHDTVGSSSSSSNKANDNLYISMAHAKSNDAAVFLLQQALEEYSHYERQREQQQQHLRSKGGGRSTTQFDASLQVPYSADDKNRWERESCALSVGLKRHLASPQQSSISVSAMHRLQHRGLSQVSASIGGEYLATSASDSLHSGTTSYAVDARWMTNTTSSSTIPTSSQKTTGTTKDSAKNRRPFSFLPPAPYLSFRTSRQLASETTLVVGLSGKVCDKITWNYSITSFRYLQFFFPKQERSNKADTNEQEESLKVQALWRCGLQATTWRLGLLMAQLRTINTQAAAAPQYCLRLAATHPYYPLKVTYRSRDTNTTHEEGGNLVVSYSMGWWNVWNRVKVTWCQKIAGGRFTCQFGLKYDGRAWMNMLPNVSTSMADAASGGFGSLALWTLLLHVYSNEWSIRIPIYLASASSSSVVPTGAFWMVYILLSQWLQAQLEEWTMQRERQQVTAAGSMQGTVIKGETGSLSSILLLTLPDMMHQVAAKKRDLESQIDGLVVLSVAIDNTQQKDLPDLLQFWVVESSLKLPTKDLLLQFDSQKSHQDRPNWWKFWLPTILQGRTGIADTSSSTVLRRLDVRYQYQGFVYETFFTSDDDRIVLPNKNPARSMRLGLVNQVQ